MLAQLVKRLPEKSQVMGWNDLRHGFRSPLAGGESVEDRLRKADERLSFLRMVTPKDSSINQSGKWIYKDGKRVEGHEATKRDGNGRVVSNWDGKNLDPDSVKLHTKQLNRAGFLNNSHAKGIF
jgi:hypothetical protein